VDRFRISDADIDLLAPKTLFVSKQIPMALVVGWHRTEVVEFTYYCDVVLGTPAPYSLHPGLGFIFG